MTKKLKKKREKIEKRVLTLKRWFDIITKLSAEKGNGFGTFFGALLIEN